MVRAAAETIWLEPISVSDSELLLQSLGAPEGVIPQIAEAAEGNPLFAQQLAVIADELDSTSTMPRSIRGVLHERLDRLADGERSLLERAAVEGRTFTVDALSTLTPVPDSDLVEERLLSLVRQRFVRPDPLAVESGFRFEHSLIRDAVYDATPKTLRADLHERLAGRLDKDAAEDAIVGHHLERAFTLLRELDRPAPALGIRAGSRLRAAGEGAFGRSDVPAAIGLLDRSLAVLPAGDAARPAVLIELGYARIKRGEVSRAIEDLDEAIAAAHRLGDRAAELRALVERQFARSVSAAGPTADESERVALAAIAELELLDEPLALARAWWLKSERDVFACRWRERAAAL